MASTTPSRLLENAMKYADQPALSTPSGEGWATETWSEFATYVMDVARALVALGFEPGDKLSIYSYNRREWYGGYLAAQMAGGAGVGIYHPSSAEEVEWVAGNSESKVLFVGDNPMAAGDKSKMPQHRLMQVIDGLPAVEHFVLLPGVGGVEHERMITWDAFMGHGSGVETATLHERVGALTEADTSALIYTSGTTGNPKGAYSDHLGVVSGTMNYICQTAMVLQLLTERGDAPTVQPSALVAVPLFHVPGEVPLFLQSFAMGRKLVLMPKWDATNALELLEKEQITYFVGVPLMSYEIAVHPEREKYDLSQCKTFAGGGAARPIEHVKKIKDAFKDGFPALGYGLTETNGVGAGNLNENYLAKPNSTGMPSLPLVDMAILDDDGEPLPQGQIGEVSIRSVCNFLGYWKNEDATKAAFSKDGYFRTGDLGYLDEDNYLFIVDRKKDIIIRGGENISCIEVEEAIYAHPKVAECSVFGLPDERFGEIPAAVYFPHPGQSLSVDELQEFLREHIAAFKVPSVMWQSEEQLPRLGTQKVDKRTVKATFAKEHLAA